MKRLALLSTLLILVISSISCKGQGSKQQFSQTDNSKKVVVYYFHFTHRCATCLAVEENARKAVEALFPNEVKAGEYSFASLNLDEATTKEIADKLGIGGQTLIVVRGDKKIDITGSAWMAANDPDKMKAEIKSGIDKILL
jgi:hypothetical protein